MRINNQENSQMNDDRALFYNKCYYCDCEDCIEHNRSAWVSCHINCQFCEGGKDSIIGCIKYKSKNE